MQTLQFALIGFVCGLMCGWGSRSFFERAAWTCVTYLALITIILTTSK